MNEKSIILAARVMSVIFTPLYLPFVALCALFVFSYLSLLPSLYKLIVLGLVFIFTILLPTLLIHIYRHWRGWSLVEIGTKERRVVPYLISIICYFLCCHIMRLFHIPHFMASILIAALLIQIICASINIWWKISTHTAGIGGIVGALAAFASIFFFNPVWWICIALVVAGAVGTSRMILRQHTITQVVTGFLTGLVIAYFMVLYV